VNIHPAIVGVVHESDVSGLTEQAIILKKLPARALLSGEVEDKTQNLLERAPISIASTGRFIH
jgi:hypothetical protein